MGSVNEIFQECLRLVGKRVSIGLRSGGKPIKGQVLNAMFDSLLIESGGQNQVIAFSDLGYVELLPAP